MSLKSTVTSGLSVSRPLRSIRRDPPDTNPAVIAAGFSETTDVGTIAYVAGWIGFDTEECIQKALEDDEIEMFQQTRDGSREFDVYRLTARGRHAADKHLREVFQRSAERARRDYEAELRGELWPAVDGPGDRELREAYQAPRRGGAP